MKKVRDVYSRAVEYFRKHPDRIQEAWNTAKSDRGDPWGKVLFGAAAANPKDLRYGCLTQIRICMSPVLTQYRAQTPELTEMIQADKNLPSGGEVKPNHLKYFAAWRRKIDKILGLEPIPAPKA
jgi:hypothetical protein